jgi:hypothetical protein
MGMVLTIAGLILTAVGLIALRPQVTVSPGEPLARSQPLEASFCITNSGLLTIHGVKVVIYVHHFEIPSTMTLDDSTFSYKGWEGGILERGETETILWNFGQLGVASPSMKADIAIVVDYALPLVSFYHSRRYFRFAGQYGDNWRWLAQPSAGIQADADAAIKRAEEGMKRLKN